MAGVYQDGAGDNSSATDTDATVNDDVLAIADVLIKPSHEGPRIGLLRHVPIDNLKCGIAHPVALAQLCFVGQTHIDLFRSLKQRNHMIYTELF
jgi:hypothetical protein